MFPHSETPLSHGVLSISQKTLGGGLHTPPAEGIFLLGLDNMFCGLLRTDNEENSAEREHVQTLKVDVAVIHNVERAGRKGKHPSTLSTPRGRVFRSEETVFNQPNTSSIFLRFC